MVTDVQLAIFANMLGVSLFLLVVLYHYVAVNNPKKQEWGLAVCLETWVQLLFSPYILHLIEKLKYVSLQTSSSVWCMLTHFIFFFFPQVRWKLHHGNNIPVFHASFQQLNIYVKLHSYDFFLIKICELYSLSLIHFCMHTTHTLNELLHCKEHFFKCPFIYTSSLFQVPTQFCSSHSII